MNDTSPSLLHRVQQRAMQELAARDRERRKAALLRYRHIQALKEGRWTVVLDELDRQARRTVRTLWLTAAFLVVATAGHALYAISPNTPAWSGALPALLVPGLWLAYGIYAVRVTTERLQHLERARVALEIVREEDERGQAAVENEI